jgi:hypothetical protein
MPRPAHLARVLALQETFCHVPGLAASLAELGFGECEQRKPA